METHGDLCHSTIIKKMKPLLCIIGVSAGADISLILYGFTKDFKVANKTLYYGEKLLTTKLPFRL